MLLLQWSVFVGRYLRVHKRCSRCLSQRHTASVEVPPVTPCHRHQIRSPVLDPQLPDLSCVFVGTQWRTARTAAAWRYGSSVIISDRILTYTITVLIVNNEWQQHWHIIFTLTVLDFIWTCFWRQYVSYDFVNGAECSGKATGANFFCGGEPTTWYLTTRGIWTKLIVSLPSQNTLSHQLGTVS